MRGWRCPPGLRQLFLGLFELVAQQADIVFEAEDELLRFLKRQFRLLRPVADRLELAFQPQIFFRVELVRLLQCGGTLLFGFHQRLLFPLECQLVSFKRQFFLFQRLFFLIRALFYTGVFRLQIVEFDLHLLLFALQLEDASSQLFRFGGLFAPTLHLCLQILVLTRKLVQPLSETGKLFLHLLRIDHAVRLRRIGCRAR